MQDAPKAVWSIPYVSVAFFPRLKQNFIAYRVSKVSSHPDCIFEIHQLWQSGFSNIYQPLRSGRIWHKALVGRIPIFAVAVHLNLKS